MEVNAFLSKLAQSLNSLDFVERYTIEEQSTSYIKIKVILKPKGFLNVWYNAVRRTQSFSLIIGNQRKWGFDYDNRLKWHEHPLENPEQHIPSNSKTIPEIIAILNSIWRSVS